MAGFYSRSGPPKRFPPLKYVPVRTEVIDGQVVTILKMERDLSDNKNATINYGKDRRKPQQYRK